MRDQSSLLSVVIPCFNESQVLPLMVERLNSVLGNLKIKSEVVLIDDGSSDSTRDMMVQYTKENPHFRAVVLSRNYGHQIALSAGLDHAKGNVIAVLDSDLQDPPELLGAMLEKWKEGFDVVYGKRTARPGETWRKTWTADVFYKVIRKLSGIDIPANVGDFRLMDRKVVDALKRMPERSRFVRGLVVWAGFSHVAFPYERPARMAGVTKYSWKKMIHFASDAIFSFSVLPLRFAIYVGGLMLALSVLSLFQNILYALILGVGGFIMLALGILGEYIGRIFVEVQNRPLYFLEGVYPDAGTPRS